MTKHLRQLNEIRENKEKREVKDRVIPIASNRLSKNSDEYKCSVIEENGNVKGKRLNSANKVYMKDETAELGKKLREEKVLEEFKNFYIQWETNLDNMARKWSGDEPHVLSEIPYFDFSAIPTLNPKLLLQTLRQCDSLSETRLNSNLLDDCKKIIVPPKYKFGTDKFELSPSTGLIARSPMKFISNYDAYDLLRNAEEIISKGSVLDIKLPDLNSTLTIGYQSTTGKRSTLLREALLMSRFVTGMTNSSRLANIPKLIQMLFETSNFSETRGFTWKSNPILITLKYLYDGWTEFPYFESNGRMNFITSCSMTLPHLTYSLLQLWNQYIMCDITKEELWICIECYVEKSIKSFDEWILDFKDYRDMLIKHLTECIQKATLPNYGIKKVNGIGEVKTPKEIWHDREEEGITLFNAFKDIGPKSLFKYLINIKVFDHDKINYVRKYNSIEEPKRLHILVNLACQHGLFIKTPVVLTLKKSILTRESLAVGATKKRTIRATLDDPEYILEYNWRNNKIFEEMMRELLPICKQYVKTLSELDFKQEFIRALTNNSGGVDYEPTENEYVGIPSPLLKTIGKKRLFYFLFNPLIYSDYDEYAKAVQCITFSGERKQVDRRGRVIQMVSNAGQLSAFLLFQLVDVMGGKLPEFSSKKGTGTIRDILDLLFATSNENGANECADISGMDASTTKLLTSFTFDLLSRVLQEIPTEDYFWAHAHDWHVTEYDGDKAVSTNVIKLPATIELLVRSEQIADNTNYRLKVPELNFKDHVEVIETSAEAFPSGKFSTNAQHNLINLAVLKAIITEFKKSSEEFPNKDNSRIQVKLKISGDDIIVEMYYDGENDKIFTSFSKLLSSYYAGLGLGLTSSLSRYYATFLQQSAYFGTILGKPNRLSLVSSEHGEAQREEVFKSFSEIKDLLQELSSRVAFPENWVIIGRCYANILRRIRMIINYDFNKESEVLKFYEAAKEKINVMTKAKFPLSWFKIEEKFYHLLPYWSLYLPDGFGLPPPPLYDDVNGLFYHGLSSYTPTGDIQAWFLRRILRCGIDITTFVPTKEEEVYVKLSNIDFKLKSVDMSEGSNLKSKTDIAKEYFDVCDKILHTIIKQYDINLIRWFQLPWLKHILSFNGTQWMKDRMRRKVDKKVRTEWAKTLENQLSPGAIMRSRLAGYQLNKMQEKYPEEIAFYKSPEERIKQAIESLPSQNEDFIQLRQALFFHLVDFRTNDDWIPDITKESLYLFDEVTYTQSFEPKLDLAVDGLTYMSLSSNKSLERQIILGRFGYNFLDGGALFSGYYGKTPGPWKKYNHEAMMKFITRILYTKPAALSLVWNLVNVRKGMQEELIQMILAGDVELEYPWKSILATRQYFELSHNPFRILDQWTENDYLLDSRLKKIVNLIKRDLSLSALTSGFRMRGLYLHWLFGLYNSQTHIKLATKAQQLRDIQRITVEITGSQSVDA